MLSASHSVGGLALIPGGVALVHSGTLWLASSQTGEFTKVETSTDPHALVSDGKWLYWLGHEKNEKLNLRTHEKSHVARFAPAARQRGLAVGDALYGFAEEAQVSRIGKRHVNLAHRANPYWASPGHLEAGEGILAFAVIDRTDMSSFLWRTEVRKKGVRVDADLQQTHAWSLHNDGRLIFFRDGHVMSLGRKSKTPRPLFGQGDLTDLCWCGRDVCGISETVGEARVHHRGKPESTVVADAVGKPGFLRCSDQHIAWTTAGESKSTEVHLAPLKPGKLLPVRDPD